MNSYTERSTALERHRHRLERLIAKPNYVTAYHPRQLAVLVSRTAEGLMHWLTKGAMPRISREIQGDTEVWKVYDPISNQTLYFDQENAVRVWMEERYYQ